MCTVYRICKTYEEGGGEDKVILSHHFFQLFNNLLLFSTSICTKPQYTEARKLYLKNHPKVSKYDSENLMYSLIEDILAENKYASLDVVCHFPLNKLIRSSELLSDEERRYVAQSGTHVDFLIYSRLGKKPILAIEVDGYEYHQAESKQAFRDSKKNHIFSSESIQKVQQSLPML